MSSPAMRILRAALPALMILSGCVTLRAASQPADTISARRAFLEMPDAMLDMLPRTTRSYMLVYFDNDSIWDATNSMGGKSRLTDVTPDYLGVRITDVSLMQIKVLPSRKRGDVVMALYTIDGERQAGDSNVTFYDSSMRPLKRKGLLPDLRLEMFFDLPKGCPVSMKEVKETIPFPTVVLSASPADDSLTARLTAGEYIGREEMERLKPYMLPVITFDWDGTGYRLRRR